MLSNIKGQLSEREALMDNICSLQRQKYNLFRSAMSAKSFASDSAQRPFKSFTSPIKVFICSKKAYFQN